MKNYFIIICLQFSFVLSFAQLKKTIPTDFVVIGEAGGGVSFVAKFGYQVVASDTLYSIFYNNLQFTHISDIQSLTFKNQAGAVDSLYAILKTLATGPKGIKQDFKLGEDEVVATAVKVPGFKGVNITNKSTGSYFGLNAKQINRLFGKKDE